MWLSVSKTGGGCGDSGPFWSYIGGVYRSGGNWHGNSMPLLQPGDIVVADSAYGTYVDLAFSPFGEC